METVLEEVALSWGTKLWLYPGKTPGFHSRDEHKTDLG